MTRFSLITANILLFQQLKQQQEREAKDKQDKERQKEAKQKKVGLSLYLSRILFV